MNELTQPGGNQPLPVGHKLLWYTLEEVLGHGGFGTTYLGIDTNLNRKVAIKEYLPSIFAFRGSDYTVQPLTGDHADNYQWGLNSFLNEARTLAQFKHRNVVQVQTVFEEYNTAYMVMEYEQGDPLDSIFKTKGDSLNQPFFENLLFLVMDGLQSIHDAGFIHRDIKPGNLYIRSDGSPVLIDFGSARQTSQQETSEMTTLVSQGYTPLEQYSPNFGDQGPWTDIYSLAASVYHGVVGAKPEDALNRSASLLSSKPDPLPGLATMQLAGYNRSFCEAIDTALALKPNERPQSLSTWKQLFDAATTDKPASTPNTPDDDATRLLPPGSIPGVDTHPAITPPASTHDNNDYHRHNHNVDTLDWDQPVSTAEESHYAATAQDTPATGHQSPKQGTNAPLFIGGGLLLVALAAGGWWITKNNNQPLQATIVTADLLSALPGPAQPSPLVVPAERIATEISELRALSVLYQNLLQIDPESGQGKEGLTFVLDNYRSMSKLPAVRYNSSLQSKLAQAVDAVTLNTGTNGQAEQLAGEIAAIPDSPGFSALSPLLDNTSRSNEDNETLVFALGALDATERSQAIADTRVVNLTRNFKESIVDSIKGEEFERASHMISLALLVNPDDQELILLKAHLE